jgi:hypothetical protein
VVAFIPVSIANNFSLLIDAVSSHRRDDCYSNSPAYFALTGRKGLWIAEEGERRIVVCVHPNRPNDLLIFPPFGGWSERMVELLEGNPLFEGKSIRLSRVHSAADVPSLQCWRRVAEDTLDWAYPVHVLDTKMISESRGNAYGDFRNNYNNAAVLERLSVDMLDPVVQSQRIIEFADEWIAAEGFSPDTAEGYLGPLTLLLHAARALRIRGLAATKAGRIVGISVWEETDPVAGIANGFVCLGLRGVRGCTEFLQRRTCEFLAQNGFRFYCIGGSETASLDNFKKKMRPAWSLELSTYVPIVTEGRRDRVIVAMDGVPSIAPDLRTLTGHSDETSD